ncbi:unnamed protein product [Closterium sp. NIES-65]|nr:unnamed protein product [Closterium sp. NIES-65]
MCIMYQLVEPLTGKTWSLSDFDGHPALLVMFICNHCPFVVHIKSQLVALGNEYISKHGLAVVAISSNSVLTHPQDGPDKMAEEAKQFNFPFPYLYDETQEVAKAYHAACTPDFFLFKKDGRSPLSPTLTPDSGGGQDLSRCLHARLLSLQKGRPPPPLSSHTTASSTTPAPTTARPVTARTCVLLSTACSLHDRSPVRKGPGELALYPLKALTLGSFSAHQQGPPSELAYHCQLDDSRPSNGPPGHREGLACCPRLRAVRSTGPQRSEAQ